MPRSIYESSKFVGDLVSEHPQLCINKASSALKKNDCKFDFRINIYSNLIDIQSTRLVQLIVQQLLSSFATVLYPAYILYFTFNL